LIFSKGFGIFPPSNPQSYPQVLWKSFNCFVTITYKNATKFYNQTCDFAEKTDAIQYQLSMAKEDFLKWGIIILLVACLASCSAKRPVLYPNVQLKKVGKSVSQGDIDACLQLAEAAGLESGEGKKLAMKTAGGALAGAVIGAATGAITGHPGRGAAIGAAGGGSGGFIHWLFQANEVDPVMRRYVEECLREKGYRPIGWH